MAELVFFCGTMDSGKSTLALQVDHTRTARGLVGMLFTRRDRAGAGRLSSRLGLERPATEVADDDDLWQAVVDERLAGRRTDYLVCDEAQFYTPAQVDQLARVVDELGVDVFAFGITSDFRARLFPGLPAPRRAGRPGRGAAGRGAVLVRGQGHAQRPHRGRADGRRRRPGGGRRRHGGRRRRDGAAAPRRPTWPTRCSAAGTSCGG